MPGDIRSNALELSADLLEPVVDAVLDDSVLREIPILGSVIKFARLGRSVSDHIFLTKIRRFLSGLGKLTGDERERFARELENDPKTAERLGQSLALTIDAMNDLEKAPILALVFAAYVRGEITIGELLRLNSAVNLAMAEDLWLFAGIERGAESLVEVDHRKRLAAMRALRITGLTEISDSAWQFSKHKSYINNAVTPAGETLIEILKASGGLT